LRNGNGNVLRLSTVSRRRDLTARDTAEDAVRSVRKTEVNETANLRTSKKGKLVTRKAGDLGFEPGSPASTSHWKDIGLTLEKPLSPVFTIQPALVYIVVALG